ncbi:FAD/NAD(P)-binding protein [Streptomonospora nanhaiensis]|uniref:FAD/NAD(P)-binding protein n=3 Tax=Streptomonospora nanhaiensis TaxID=1323731 RepID=UPI001C385819|nr:FAD/NAD(P)-binding protein [Streptomonospora nanhaiensis]MBV2363750.1 FAD/NAD(P)-binding protein [Streptomonospora nanhaiensis]
MGLPASEGGAPAVVFAGGGPGAALTAIALLRATTWLRLVYRIVLLDEHGRFARGRVYGSPGGDCPLEAPVKDMSALPDRPCHLLEWRRAAGAACGPGTVLARRVYGDYLADTLAATAAWAAPHAALVTRTARVAAVEADDAGARVLLADGGRVEAAAVVVATGDPAEAAPPRVAGALRAGAGAEGAAGAGSHGGAGCADGAAGAGLAACRCGAVLTGSGEPARRVFAVGAVRDGGPATVPRMRDQAEALAQRIADTVLRTPPGRAG